MPENTKTNSVKSVSEGKTRTSNSENDLIAKLGEELNNFNPYTKPKQVGEYCVEGIMPRAAAFPNNTEHLAFVLKTCNEHKASVIVRGSGTKMSMGAPPRAVDIILSTSRLNRVIDHDADNLTVTVEAGIKLADLQHSLSSKRQFVPLGASPLSTSGVGGSATIGGIFAANVNGPKRLLYGSARDFVLGVKVALPDGRIIRAGGKTVKNVAGYDMSKLFIGSLGSLGVIVEATLRLLPIPESTAIAYARFPKLDDCTNTVAKILDSSLIPSAIVILDPKASERLNDLLDLSLPQGGFCLAASAEGFAEGVERQLSEIESLCRGEGADAVERFGSQEEHIIWQSIPNLTMDALRSDAASVSPKKPVVCKVSVPISCAGRVISVSSGGGKDGSLFGELDRRAVAYAGSGIVYVSIDLISNPPVEEIAKAIKSLRTFANQLEGSLVIEQAPAYIKKAVDVWDRPGKTFKIVQSLKSSFDPNVVLNPGRFIGGL